MLPELKPFPNLIKSHGDSVELQRLLSQDAEYLWNAYQKIETFWYNEFSQFNMIRVVLLSEAPFFGEFGSYFYNPEWRATQFFGYADYTKALSKWGPELQASPKDSVAVKKAELLAAMRKVGVIVLDIFPFALNPKTKYSYANLPPADYANLFKVTASIYFRHKLKYVATRLVPGGKFVFRYKRVQDAAEALVKREIKKAGLQGSQLYADNVGNRGGSLNREMLMHAYAEAGV